MRERTRSLPLAVAVLAVCALGAPGGRERPGGAGRLSGHLRGAARRHRRGALPAEGPLHDHAARSRGAQLRRGLRPVPAVPRGLGTGKLPRPWVVDAASARFTRGANGAVGFSVAPAGGGGGGGGGGHHPAAPICPGTFQVLHDDSIGDFFIPKGHYRITLLSVGRITCSRAAAYFARFLQDYDGVLPTPWVLDEETASFMRGSRNIGFRIKGWVGPAHPSGGGGGTHPTANRCPGTFRVLNNDSIGKLRLRKGPYRITLVNRGLSCKRASQLFTSLPPGLRRRPAAALEVERPDRHIHPRRQSQSPVSGSSQPADRCSRPTRGHTAGHGSRPLHGRNLDPALPALGFRVRAAARGQLPDGGARLPPADGRPVRRRAARAGGGPRVPPDPRGGGSEGPRRAWRGDRGDPPARPRDGRRHHGPLARPGRRAARSARSARRRSSGATPTSTQSRWSSTRARSGTSASA